MARAFRQDNTNAEKEHLIAQIRENYGRVVYTHKTHEKAADIYHNQLHTIKVLQITLSALTTGSLLYHLFSGNKIGSIIASVLSAILFILNIYTKEYNLAELSQKHHSTAQKLWNIRESYISLLTDLTAGTIDNSAARKKRDQLQYDLSQIYEHAPRTFTRAYKQARKGLKFNEELTFSEDEINKFLPEKMRQ